MGIGTGVEVTLGGREELRRNLVANPQLVSSAGWNTGAMGVTPTFNQTLPGAGWEGATKGLAVTWPSGTTGFNFWYGDIAVKAGERVSGSFLVRASWAGRAAVTFEFLNSVGGTISYVSGSFITFIPNVPTRVFVDGLVAPAGTTKVHIFCDSQGGTAGPAGASLYASAFLVEKTAVAGPYFDGSTTPKLRRNLATNPALRTGSTDWSFAANTVRSATGGVLGRPAIQQTRASASVAVATTARSPVIPGETWSASALGVVPTGNSMAINIMWLDAGGAAVGESSRSYLATMSGGLYWTTAANTPTRWGVTGVVPSNATQAELRIFRDSDADGVTYATDALFEKDGSPQVSYFDGVTPADGLTATWEGAANLSPSYLYDPNIISVWGDTAHASTSIIFSTRQRIENISGYTVTEDSTPLDPSDLTGGVGQITVDTREVASTKSAMSTPLSITDGSLGVTTGTVRGLGGDKLGAKVQADSRIGNLAVERTIPPFTGTLTAGLTALFALCGITTGIVIDTALNSINVKLPGGRENVYDRLKRLTSAFAFEVSLVSNNIVCRAPRQRIAVNYRDADVNWELDRSNLAQAVSGWYYNHASGTQIAYPPHGEVDEVQPIQVDANEVKVQEFVMDASLSSVTQPIPASNVTRYDLTASQYSVSDSEGLIVEPGAWIEAGGSVSVAIGEDTRTLIVTITGADLQDRAPFRIGQPVEGANYYSTLRILGTGIFWDRKLLVLPVTTDVDAAPDEMGVEVDNIFMETYDQLFHRLLLTAARFGNDTQTINVQTGGINRLGDTGSARYPTIGEYNAAYPGTIGTVATQLGPTIGDWNAELFAMVSGDFSNQAFGNVNGARVLYDNSYYRIRTATVRPVGMNYTAERDNVVGDVYRTGETIGQWNARWGGKTIRDVNIAPLQGL